MRENFRTSGTAAICSEYAEVPQERSPAISFQAPKEPGSCGRARSAPALEPAAGRTSDSARARQSAGARNRGSKGFGTPGWFERLKEGSRIEGPRRGFFFTRAAQRSGEKMLGCSGPGSVRTALTTARVSNEQQHSCRHYFCIGGRSKPQVSTTCFRPSEASKSKAMFLARISGTAS